jgi:hypothetical protein
MAAPPHFDHQNVALALCHKTRVDDPETMSGSFPSLASAFLLTPARCPAEVEAELGPSASHNSLCVAATARAQCHVLHRRNT